MARFSPVIASDSDAIQTRRLLQSLSRDCFALLAMTPEVIRLQRDALQSELALIGIADCVMAGLDLAIQAATLRAEGRRSSVISTVRPTLFGWPGQARP
jgi:hypothetical protein